MTLCQVVSGGRQRQILRRAPRLFSWAVWHSCRMGARNQEQTRGRIGPQLRLGNLRVGELHFCPLCTALDQASSLSRKLAYVPGLTFGFVKLLASSGSHCTKWADEQHRQAGFESRLLPDLPLPFIPTLIGLRAFDLVSSRVWWEAATNICAVWHSCRMGARNQEQTRGRIGPQLRLGNLRVGELHFCPLCTALDQASSLSRKLAYVPGPTFGFVKPLASSGSHCTKWADEQHWQAGFESRLLPDLPLPFIPTLIGLRAFDLVSSRVWWEAATNTTARSWRSSLRRNPAFCAVAFTLTYGVGPTSRGRPAFLPPT